MLNNYQKRLVYLGFTFLIVILGIFFREIKFIPMFVGDILYAVMVYFGLKFFFLLKSKLNLLLSLLFCFAIEFSQTIQWEWLLAIRKTQLGHYVLGEGFLFTDLICYTIGNFIAFTLNNIILKFKT